jgi:hypothetical protein
MISYYPAGVCSPFFNRFFSPVRYSFAYTLERLKIHNLRKARYHLHTLLFTQVYLWSKLCRTLLKILNPLVPAKDIRDFSRLNIYLSSRTYPSATCASAADVMGTLTDIFGTKTASVNHIL